MKKIKILGLGLVSVLFFTIIILVAFFVFAGGGGGGGFIPSNGKQIICDVTLKKPAQGDTYIVENGIACRWGGECSPYFSLYTGEAVGNVELYVDGNLQDREQYNLVYGLLPDYPGIETYELRGCLMPGPHNMRVVVRDDDGNQIGSPAQWQENAPYPTTTTTVSGATTTTSSTTTTLFPYCRYVTLKNPVPGVIPGRGGLSHPEFYETAQSRFCLTPEGNGIRGEVHLVNYGEDMQEVHPEETYVLEMQVRSAGRGPLSVWWESGQRTCDSMHPENVHKVFGAVYGRKQTMTLESTGLRHNKAYDIYLCSVTKCYNEVPTGNDPVSPYDGCPESRACCYMTSLTTR